MRMNEPDRVFLNSIVAVIISFGFAVGYLVGSNSIKRAYKIAFPDSVELTEEVLQDE